jgi:hypothetical protein
MAREQSRAPFPFMAELPNEGSRVIIFYKVKGFPCFRGRTVFLDNLNNFLDDLQRSIRNRFEQLSIALALIFPSDNW